MYYNTCRVLDLKQSNISVFYVKPTCHQNYIHEFIGIFYNNLFLKSLSLFTKQFDITCGQA